MAQQNRRYQSKKTTLSEATGGEYSGDIKLQSQTQNLWEKLSTETSQTSQVRFSPRRTDIAFYKDGEELRKH